MKHILTSSGFPAWPSMFFKPDADGVMQEQVFNGPHEVPEGWMNSPSQFDADGNIKEGEEVSLPGLEDIDPTDPDGDDDDDDETEVEGYADYNEITVEEIKQYLSDKEVPYDSGDNKPVLYKLYVAAFQASAGENEE